VRTHVDDSDAARSLAELEQRYLGALRVTRPPKSVATIAAVLSRFFAHLEREGIHDIRRVNEAHIASYVHHLATAPTRRGAPFAEWSKQSYLAAVRGFFRFLMQRNVLLMNPAASLTISKVQSLPRVLLTEAQARRLMNAPDSWTPAGKRDRALLEILYGSGLRAQECLSLDVGDIDLTRFVLHVRCGKGRRDRLVPLSGCAASALDLYLRDVRGAYLIDAREPALFLSARGRRLSRTRLQEIVSGYARVAGVTAHVTPHALRHACALHLLRGGASIRHVQVILGHSSLETTALYTRVDTRDLRRVVERSHPRERRALK
jgi:integrase/recombinase XerD